VALLAHARLCEAVLKLGPSFAACLLSFTMLGTLWLADFHRLATPAASRQNAASRQS